MKDPVTGSSTLRLLSQELCGWGKYQSLMPRRQLSSPCCLPQNPPADLTLPLGAQKNLEGSLSLQGLWVWVLFDQRQKKSQGTFSSVNSGKWTPLPTQCLQICLNDHSIRFMHRGEARREHKPSLYLCEIPQAQSKAGEEEDRLPLQPSSPGEDHQGRTPACLKWLSGEAPLQHP